MSDVQMMVIEGVKGIAVIGCMYIVGMSLWLVFGG